MSVHLNKVVIVTGGSSGIGAATVKKFISEGAKVVMVGRNVEKINKVYRDCEKLGNSPLVIKGDLTDEQVAETTVKKTIETFGKLDILINNLGEIGTKTSILDDSCVSLYDRIVSNNLRTAVVLTNLSAPHLVQSKGNIVNVSSIASVRPISVNFPYSISKAGLNQFTKCLAHELGAKRVRVNGVIPGPVRTDIISDFVKKFNRNDVTLEKIYKSMSERSALGKVCEPEEVADIISFLASESCRSVTGSLIVVDNGVLLQGLK